MFTAGPLIASHIGSDVAADLLTIAFDEEDDMVMLVDIGTNTEIVAGNRDLPLRRIVPRRSRIRRRRSNLRDARIRRRSRTRCNTRRSRRTVPFAKRKGTRTSAAGTQGCPVGPGGNASRVSQGEGHGDGPILTTIGDTPPIGICGSGLIDLLAELRRHDIMNELGAFNDGSNEYTLASKTASPSPVPTSQH